MIISNLLQFNKVKLKRRILLLTAHYLDSCNLVSKLRVSYLQKKQRVNFWKNLDAAIFHRKKWPFKRLSQCNQKFAKTPNLEEFELISCRKNSFTNPNFWKILSPKIFPFLPASRLMLL